MWVRGKITIKNPLLTVWLRLLCVLLVFFLLGMTMGSQPIRSQAINTGRVLKQSAGFVFIGPCLPLYTFNKTIGILGAIGFWCALLVTACRSRERRIRRWFYVLFTVYIVMTSIGILGEIAMGLISMAHAC